LELDVGRIISDCVAMKVYKFFTAHNSREQAEIHCASFVPFEAKFVGYVGFYQNRGWWLVERGDRVRAGRIVYVDIGLPEILKVWIWRNITCGGQVGDLLLWKRLGEDDLVWSWVQYLGLAIRVDVGVYRLPAG